MVGAGHNRPGAGIRKFDAERARVTLSRVSALRSVDALTRSLANELEAALADWRALADENNSLSAELDAWSNAYDALEARAVETAMASTATEAAEAAQRLRFGKVVGRFFDAANEDLRQRLLGKTWRTRIMSLPRLAKLIILYVRGLNRPQTLYDIRTILLANWPIVFQVAQTVRGRASQVGGMRTRNAPPITVEAPSASGVLELHNLLCDQALRGVLEALFNRLMAFSVQQGRVAHVISLNFFAGGGGDLTAINYARAVAQAGHPVLLLITDNGPRRPLPDLPSNILVVDFSTLNAPLDYNERQSLLFLLLQMVDPDVWQIVNSEVSWYLLERLPKTFLPITRIVGTVFALQFDRENGDLIGYAARFLPPCIDRLDAVISDNRRFCEDAPIRLGLQTSKSKFHVVYNPSKLEGVLSLKQALALARRRTEAIDPNAPLEVVWAGRLDEDKRIDILYEVAKATRRTCNFRIYGAPTIDKHDWEAKLSALPNVQMMGAFSVPSEMDEPVLVQAFLFTSVWEGMPNAVVEAAFMGMPIVASAVGGLPELLTSETGAPISPNASAQAYVEALLAIRENPGSARIRAEAAAQLVFSRHVFSKFSQALRATPGYVEEV